MGRQVVLAACVCVLVSAGGAGAAAGKQTVMLAAADGKRLATDVYLPAGKGPWPVVLVRTPYDKNKFSLAAATGLGYALVVQDMRGRFASEGENIPFVGCGWGEHTDGADTMAWLLKQSWCNGKVGTMGGSAAGITQNLLAGAGAKGLTSQYIQVAAGSLYDHATYVGGALRLCQVEGWMKQFHFDAAAARLMRAHPLYDAYWAVYDSTSRHGTMTVPAIHVGGWFDTFSQGTIDSFTGRQIGGGPGAAGRQKLVMGPWCHDLRTAGSKVSFPNSQLPGRYGPIPWFEETLRGRPSGSVAAPAVAYYVMGDTTDRRAPGNEWRYAPAWPVPARPTPWYFQKDAALSTSPPPGAGEAFRQYAFDPANPCPTLGGRNLMLARGPVDQRPIETRADVLTFTSGPLSRPLEVTGRLAAKVWVSSSAVDTDLSVRFCDVYPDGTSLLMTDGMLRLRRREGQKRDVPLTPDAATEVTVDCWSISLVLNRGHRLRVTVTSSNYPRFDLNGGLGKPWTAGDESVVQTNRIWCDGAHPSHIVLPVVEKDPR